MKTVVRWIAFLIGGLVGLLIGNALATQSVIMNYIPYHNVPIVYAGCTLITALIFYFIYPLIISALRLVTHNTELALQDSSAGDLIMQIMGLVIGLVIAALVSSAFNTFPVPGVQWLITIILYLFFGYLGWTLSRQRSDELLTFFNRFRRSRESNVNPAPQRKTFNKKKTDDNAKLLDTSVIIDGRIVDIFHTHFIEGPLYIPVYVLNELQHISDSSDDLKRSKGRRGLDIVAQLQEDFKDDIRILDEDFLDLTDVDSKLIQTAKDRKYKILTNDYNLNKLASVQGITILNINDLANAVKIVLLPGEEVEVTLLKAGKEPGQAIAYLEDGTMIVVEQAKSLIGKHLPVIVTSAYQTAAGRMIFAKPKDGHS